MNITRLQIIGRTKVLDRTSCISLAAACEIHQRVLVVSIDGLRPDAITHTESPTLHRLIAEGKQMDHAETILPSITLPSHTSMLTGVGPAKHLVDWNSWEPERGAIQVPTIFELAHQNGKSTMMAVGKIKFRHIAKTMDRGNRSVDHYLENEDTAELISSVVTQLRTQVPNLTFLHLPDVDEAGHKKGWMSPAQLAAVEKVDAYLGKVITAYQKLAPDAAIIITADHGGHGLSHGSSDPSDMRIPWIIYGAGQFFELSRNHLVTYDTAATAASLLGLAVPPAWSWDGASALLCPR